MLQPNSVSRFSSTARLPVILAANGFPSLLKRYRYRTVPVYDYATMTEPLTDDQLATIGWHGISDMSNQFHYYRLSKDNRILWGGYDGS